MSTVNPDSCLVMKMAKIMQQDCGGMSLKYWRGWDIILLRLTQF